MVGVTSISENTLIQCGGDLEVSGGVPDHCNVERFAVNISKDIIPHNEFNKKYNYFEIFTYALSSFNSF